MRTLTSAEVSPEWIAVVQECAERSGFPMRAGKDPRIEVKSLTTNKWGPLMLEGSLLDFATAQDRDEVLRRIWAKREAKAS